MAGEISRYELHFHGLVQDAIAVDPSKVKQILQGNVTQPTFAHHLPSDLTDFIGRQAELDRVAAQLRQATLGQEKTPLISVVTGAAGVGKSALALHVAHQLKPDFPDAQLYVNLRGTEGQPLEPLEVLAGFLSYTQTYQSLNESQNGYTLSKDRS
ncbi:MULTISPECIES: AAA family ATPase [unclassified Coleofasciculus]|uniref:AAA family ATPase n=1 Tax=unclassified Coleofasciculus TaxID=2692782 RepID=UPI00187F57EC|nr:MULTISPECIES: ATP-binding protein [unclassified Coleofasciculus]MBE9124594.1 ATP-binding protein [Coleofasciculus sp. LEGE 07081]MBE9147557.1 ATP-binding protein [Coleofasciculus sp. LEGE 07092]